MDDVPVLTRLLNERYRRFAGEDQLSEAQLAADWENPRIVPERDMRVLVDSDGRAVGWAELEPPGAPHVDAKGWVSVDLGVSRERSTWQILLDWIEARARAATCEAQEGLRTYLTVWALEKDSERREVYARLGYLPVRAMHRMRVDLTSKPEEPVWPDGLVLGNFNAERDLGPLAAASREAFRDHWGHLPVTLEEEEREWQGWLRTHAEAIDPSLSTLAWDGEQVAGFALGRWHLPLDRSRGVVASLAVRPAWRRRGLGSALLRNALGEFQRRGCGSAELMVDSANLTGALRLYEQVGFRAFRTQVVYEKELRAGVDVAQRGT
jgi:mycothiol synthase